MHAFEFFIAEDLHVEDVEDTHGRLLYSESAPLLGDTSGGRNKLS